MLATFGGPQIGINSKCHQELYDTVVDFRVDDFSTSTFDYFCEMLSTVTSTNDFFPKTSTTVDYVDFLRVDPTVVDYFKNLDFDNKIDDFLAHKFSFEKNFRNSQLIFWL